MTGTAAGRAASQDPLPAVRGAQLARQLAAERGGDFATALVRHAVSAPRPLPPEEWPPTSYRRLRRLMDRGQGHRAPGPCAIPGCTLARPDPRPLATPFVWDHCHAHDYVRGILCRIHNGMMAPVDNQDHAKIQWWSRLSAATFNLAALTAYWERCPECSSAGPWQPIMVRHSTWIVQSAAERIARDARAASRAASRAAP